MRHRATGILFVLSGTCFLAGVLDPPILPTWGGSAADLMATGSAHRAAWFASTWLITFSIVAGLAAVELLARTLDTDLARVGRSLYIAGSALGLASTTYDLAVTSTLLGAPRLPDWYFGIQHWADGLSTAYFALLAPAAMGCLGLAILRTRVLPRWTGYVFLAAAVLLLGQYAAFRGALPFPQFLAFIAVGIAALGHRAPTALPPQAIVGIPGPDRLSALAGYPCVRPHGGWSLLIDTRSMGLTPGEASRRLFTRAQVAGTPMDGWGPSGSRYLRLVFATEPAERLTGLRARFDTALS